MSQAASSTTIPAHLTQQLQRSTTDTHPVVIMTCGIAGSGKTTLAKTIESLYPTFHRLSIDEINTEKHGIYGIDYAASPSLYDQYMGEADTLYLSTFTELLVMKQDVILERAFYAKEDRDEYRKLAEEAGARVVLVYLKAEGGAGKEVLWKRICDRSKEEKTAANAFKISKETLKKYWEGFEEPVGEGEVVIQVG